MNEPTVRPRRFLRSNSSITWRGILLASLYVVPLVVYLCLGALWLFENGLLLYGLVGWLICTIIFSILSKRWLRHTDKILPPLDWEKPWTFAPRDSQAWTIVQETAERGSELTLERLSRIDTYRDTTDDMARRIAACYYPNVENPLDKIPIVDLIVAIQLAADDLERLCRQIPVMDQLTPGHLKGLTKAMGLAQSANELYNFALPVFRPVTGIPRLLVQKLVAEPAWRQTKEGVQRWLFRAYVNRLGVHLVELCSGRLRAGSSAYRRSTTKPAVEPTAAHTGHDEPSPATSSGVPLTAILLSPASEDKSIVERIGVWRHLSKSGQHEIAAALNERFLPLAGLGDLTDIAWERLRWPIEPDSILPQESGESWDDTTKKLVAYDLIVADFRHLSDDEAANRAQSLLNHVSLEYDRRSEWPVAPIVLLSEQGVLTKLEIPPNLLRETKISDIAMQNFGQIEDDSDLGPARDPEIEVMAAVTTMLPIARHRQFARSMVIESRRSGIRRAAGQVAEAAGKAGVDLVRGWLGRRAKSEPASADASKRANDDG
jgi:hypothetical protein